RRPCDCDRGRQVALQSVRRHACKPAETYAREEGVRASLHRLADIAGRSESHRRIQDRRPAAIFPKCQRSKRLSRSHAPKWCLAERARQTPQGGCPMATRSLVAITFVAGTLALHPGPAAAAEIKVLTAGAMKSVVLALQGGFETASGHRLVIDNDTAGGLVKRIEAGEAFDM